MTVSTYLRNLASDAIIRNNEKESIKRSITVIKSRLGVYFGSDIEEQFIFGSYTRDTILPRTMDERSDIDYMVVFKNDGSKPQTYLNRLRRFVKQYYATSEIKQSHPTIQLKLNHITFELVPALEGWWSSYHIPSKSYNVDDWMKTNPNDFNRDLIEKNKEYDSNIKPLARLMKYWNAKNGYIFDSFDLEKWIIAQNFYGPGFFGTPELKHCLYQCFEEMPTRGLSGSNVDRVNRAKQIVQRVQTLERSQQYALAELEIKKLLPVVASKRRGSLLYGS